MGCSPVRADEPVCHVSYYEADAFARWAGARLATEFEWEAAAQMCAIEGNFVESWRAAPAYGIRGRPVDSDVRRRVGVDGECVPGLSGISSRRQEPWANTTASSCATRWCCAEDRARPRSRTFAGHIAISFRRTRAGSSWGSGWPMATSKQLQFLPNAATAMAARQGLSASPKRLPS